MKPPDEIPQTSVLPPAKPATTQWVPVTEKPGDKISRYKLLQQIGEGGCGVVYLAEQEEPIRRRVALKVIKLGMDTRQVVARFEAERQALALMDHPNIAKVLDAGATDTGRPYFVMELVKGIRITDYCDQHDLSTEARLKLFLQVCQAIQHAHQKAIIHRDVKPSNILVTIQDGEAVPKVIDFGIAKATGGQVLTDKTLFTAVEQFIGTPAYMSPEQAEMSGLDIDTRTDIYSLGVLLYELLTGTTPFDGSELLSQGIEAMRRTIREKDPVWPSTRLTQELVAADVNPRHRGGGATTVSAGALSDSRWRVRAKETVPLVRGDLDWIVMKCLEKDRTRRYETANALAQDIDRYLTQQPTLARPPSRAYRVRKFVRRHQVMVGAGAVVAGALVLGIVASTWQAIRATRAEKAAREAAEEARQSVYAADMKAVHVALQENNRGMAVELLRRHIPKGGEKDLRGLEWRYLWQEARGDEIQTFPQTSMAGAAVLSPDGRQVAAAGYDGHIVVSELATGRPLWDFRGARLALDVFKSAAYSSDGKWLAVPGRSGVDTRDTSDWRLVRELTSAGAPFRFSRDGRYFVGNGPNGVSAWEVGTWTERVLLTNFYAGLNGLAVSQDGSQVAAGARHSKTVRWVDRHRGTTTLLEMDHDVTALEISPDGRWLAGGDHNGELSLWEIATLRLVQRFRAHSGWLLGLASSPDNRLLATGGNDQLIRIWETGTTNKVAELKGHLHEIWSLEFSQDGKTLVSGSQDGTVRFWNAAASPASSRVLNLPTNAAVVGPLEDGRALLIQDPKARTTEVWSLPEGRLTHSYGWQEMDRLSSSNHGAFPESQVEVGVGTNGTVYSWSLPTGKLLRSAALGEGQFKPHYLSADHRWLVGRFPDGKPALYDLRTVRRAPLPPVRSLLGSVAISPDGQRLACPSDLEGEILIWDLAAGRESSRLEGHRRAIGPLRFSPDSRLLASGSADSHAALWSVEDGRLVHGLMRGHHSGVDQIRFSSDGRTLLTESADFTMRWWSVATGREMLRLQDVRSEGTWNPTDTLLVWWDRARGIRVTTLPTLAEVDASETGRRH
jgi:eukaryotic-like serine/threonine-protein kinase